MLPRGKAQEVLTTIKLSELLPQTPVTRDKAFYERCVVNKRLNKIDFFSIGDWKVQTELKHRIHAERYWMIE